jgi:Methyltransferase domain
MERFLRVMQPSDTTTILDVGGYPSTWADLPIQSRITTLNVHPVPTPTGPSAARVQVSVGDGCNLPYPDKSFDIVFSNSVIEHLGAFSKQQEFAAEARRVGRALWIQTPAPSFFIEPHLMAPFIHYFPEPAQRVLIPWTPWALVGRATQSDIHQYFREVRLLPKHEFRELFPDCEIWHERFFGFTKSFVAIRR